MPSQRATIALLAVVGLLLLANPLWLFPDAGESEYTYERSTIEIEDETITFGIDDPGYTHANDLEPVGCQRQDYRTERACAFDLYLVENGPVTVERDQTWGAIRPEIVQLEGDYYRRIYRPNHAESADAKTHDVERVAPETVLAESAMNVSRISDPSREDGHLGTYVAATGETVTTSEALEADELGTVYRHDGSYYTVLLTDRTVDDRGPRVLYEDGTRRLLMFAGTFLLGIALQREFFRRRE